MNKSGLIIAAAALAGGISVPAFAQSRVAGPWYIGAGLGQSFGSGGNTSGTIPGTAIPFTASGFDDNKTSLQLNGGYQFTPEWGVEVQYTWLGERDGTLSAAGRTASFSDVKLYQYGV